MVIPLTVLYGLWFGAVNIKAYTDTLYVEGAPDEWVLILNNGKLKSADVGLKCYKGPFD